MVAMELYYVNMPIDKKYCSVEDPGILWIMGFKGFFHNNGNHLKYEPYLLSFEASGMKSTGFC